jgi:hypothetical protein
MGKITLKKLRDNMRRLEICLLHEIKHERYLRIYNHDTYSSMLKVAVIIINSDIRIPFYLFLEILYLFSPEKVHTRNTEVHNWHMFT